MQYNSNQSNPITQRNKTKRNTTDVACTTQHDRTCTRHDTTQHDTTQHNTTQYNTTQHDTTQHDTDTDTTRHNTTQHDTTKEKVLYNLRWLVPPECARMNVILYLLIPGRVLFKLSKMASILLSMSFEWSIRSASCLLLLFNMCDRNSILPKTFFILFGLSVLHPLALGFAGFVKHLGSVCTRIFCS